MFDSRAVLFNNRPIASIGAIRFGDLNRTDSGVQTPCESLGVFLCLSVFSMAVYTGKPLNGGLPIQAVGVRRFANPVYAVTIFFGEKWCRFGLNQIENTNMISIPFPVDDVSLRVNRALAITRLLQVSAEYSDLFQIQGEDAQQVLWVVEQALLEAQASIDAWCDARAEVAV